MPTQSPTRLPATEYESDSDRRAISSRHFLKLIEDMADVGFWSASLDDDLIVGSDGFHRVLGLDPSVRATFGLVVGMMHPDDARLHHDLLALLRSGQAVQREFRIIRSERTQRWIASRAEVLIGPDGRPSQAIGVVKDVTGRHNARRSVEQGRDRFEALIAAAAAVEWIGSPDGSLLEMPRWQSLTGQSRRDMQGEGWLEAVHPDDRERTRDAWRTAVSHAASYNTDFRILCADGLHRWFNARGIPILNSDGSVREWVGVCLGIPGWNQARQDPAGYAASVANTGREITPAQWRAARGIAGWSAEELAGRAGVSVSTVRRLEDGNATVKARRETVSAVREALEGGGVEFVFEPGAKPGVRGT